MLNSNATMSTMKSKEDLGGMGRGAPGFHLGRFGRQFLPGSLRPQVGSLGWEGGSGQRITDGKDQCSQPQPEDTVPAVAPTWLRAWDQTQGVVG